MSTLGLQILRLIFEFNHNQFFNHQFNHQDDHSTIRPSLTTFSPTSSAGIISREREVCAMNSLLNSNSKSSNSNISNNSTHLAQLNHQLNSLQVNQSSSFQAQLQQQQQQQQSNGQLIPHQQPQLVHHNAQLKYNRDYIENLLEGDLILQVRLKFELFVFLHVFLVKLDDHCSSIISILLNFNNH